MTPQNNTGFNSDGSKDMATELNRRFWPPHCRLRPLATELLRILAWTFPPPQSRVLAIFLPLIVWVYILSNFRGELRKTHHLCSRVWPFKVIQGPQFWRQLKGLMGLPIRGPISHRFWDTATLWLKIANFPYPCLVYRPQSGRPFRISGKALRILKLEYFRELTAKISWF